MCSDTACIHLSKTTPRLCYHPLPPPLFNLYTFFSENHPSIEPLYPALLKSCVLAVGQWIHDPVRTTRFL